MLIWKKWTKFALLQFGNDKQYFNNSKAEGLDCTKFHKNRRKK